MDKYKEMYLHLFNEVTTAIEILKNAQIKCEELFINSDDNEIAEEGIELFNVSDRAIKKD